MQRNRRIPHFKDPFDAIDFVERLAWRMTGGREQIDAAYLKNKLEEEIGSLQLLGEQFQSRLNTLEQQHAHTKANYLDALTRLHDKNAEANEKLKVERRLDHSNWCRGFPSVVKKQILIMQLIMLHILL